MENKIKQLIQDNPQCANSDMLLLFKYWETEGLQVDYSILSNLTTAESITRARRKLTEDGEIKPDATVTKHRKRLERTYQQKYGHPIVNVIEMPVEDHWAFENDKPSKHIGNYKDCYLCQSQRQEASL